MESHADFQQLRLDFVKKRSYLVASHIQETWIAFKMTEPAEAALARKRVKKNGRVIPAIEP